MPYPIYVIFVIRSEWLLSFSWIYVFWVFSISIFRDKIFEPLERQEFLSKEAEENQEPLAPFAVDKNNHWFPDSRNERSGDFVNILLKASLFDQRYLDYGIKSLDKISKRGQKLQAEAFITTEKDAVKIKNTPAFRQIPVYYLKIKLKLEEEFYSAMSSLLQNKV